MTNEELIERYFLEKLSSEELEHFEMLLASDANFQAEVAYQENLKKVIIEEENIRFKERLTSFETKHTSKSNRSLWGAAAAVILIIITSVYFFQKPTNEALFADNFEPYANVVQPVVRGENTDDLKTMAFLAYENKEYNTAIEHFTLLQTQDEGNYATFYLAISKLAIEEVKSAIPLLKDVSASQNQFTDKASWYLALAYIKDETPELALPLLEKIKSENGYNSEKASLLLKELK